MSLSSVRRLVFLFSLVCLNPLASSGLTAPWLPYGPDGGDARSFAVDPTNHEHIYLGAINGWIYESRDSGAHWLRLARVGKRDDLALDHILVDALNPKHLIVGAWVLDHPDGGIFQSFDGGKSWVSQAQMNGQSIRALTAAPSNPRLLVAGTLTGIFRSTDSGAHWDQISPPDSAEIHNLQSVAIGPDDPGVIYGGTRHLPWKTTDGGQNWSNITAQQGMIDDSDVFSIIIDPKDSKIVYASACSGIYKSENSGATFVKVKGIPNSARRTRVLKQDPEHLDTVFAGTTEGLWRTRDGGQSWTRTTGPEVIVNDVFIDPANTQHVMLATDRGGVLVSEDGGDTFLPSNRGFSARYITALYVDPQRLGTMYAGVVNDKEWGGVFLSRDGGLSWSQRSDGLRGRDVFSLAQAPDGVMVAGTGHGIFRYEEGLWTRSFDTGMLEDTAHTAPLRARTAARSTPRSKSAAGKKPLTRAQLAARARSAAAKAPTAAPRTFDPVAAVAAGASGASSSFDGVVHAIATVGDKMYAGSAKGMLVSNSAGKTWAGVPALAGVEWWFVAADKQTIAAASLDKATYSTDGGTTWQDLQLPPKVLQVSALAVDGRGEIWLGGKSGVYLSSDHGMTWQTLRNLYVTNVESLFYDPRSDQVLLTANGNSTVAFGVEVPTRKVTIWDTGWNLRFLRPVGDHLLGATLYDGVVIQPRMVDSNPALATRSGAGGGGD